MGCLNCPTPFTQSSRTAIATMTFGFWEDEYASMTIAGKKLFAESRIRSWLDGEKIFFEVPKQVALLHKLDVLCRPNRIHTLA